MKGSPTFRLLATGACALAAAFVLGKTLLSDHPLEPALPAVEFTREPRVAGWQAVREETDPTRPHTQRYRSADGELPLELELQFIPDLSVHYIRNPQIELRFLPRAHLPLDAGMNYYVSPRAKVVPNRRSGQSRDLTVNPAADGAGFWVVNDTAHLSASSTPAGDVSIVPRTVARSLYVDHLTFGQIIAWLFRRAPLPDPRCVLVHFSTPSRPEARAVLERSWSEWRAAHFPSFPPVGTR